MQIEKVRLQKRAEGLCAEFDGTDESLITHIGDKGTG